MTNKVTVVDNRTPVETGCGLAITHGSFYSCVQNGGNDPKRKVPQNYDKVVYYEADPLIQWKGLGPGWPYPGTVSGTIGSCFGFTCGTGGGTPPEITDNQELYLINKLYEKVKSHSFNAAVTLGEARESLMMIGSSARTLASAMIQLKRGRASTAWNTLVDGNPRMRPPKFVANPGSPRNLSGSWLAMQMGWMPLVSDVAEAANAAAAHFHKPVRSRFHKTVSSDGVLDTCHEGVWNISKRMLWIVEEEPDEISQLGFYDPELVLWELLPYSFLVDYFLPIGKFLEARASIAKLKGTAITTTKSMHYIKQSGFNENYLVEGSGTQKNFSFSRRVSSISNLPVPTPNFRNPLSWTHATTGLALLYQAFK